ncbi:hypothetical protein ALC57_01651 [Trachymyrmex cornetzi]|uniref:Uncharacterized protein n=1 Tax=Trachymyrmex cornetzi TaxID=471704 RepID=A0A195EMA1_9HYME|nr:hypothetical protein ALC57_01651 [Trachymyrmex cornetzi]
MTGFCGDRTITRVAGERRGGSGTMHYGSQKIRDLDMRARHVPRQASSPDCDTCVFYRGSACPVTVVINEILWLRTCEIRHWGAAPRRRINRDMGGTILILNARMPLGEIF